MKTDLSKKRVFMLCGDAQSGKTSLSEAILFKTQTIKNLGSVAAGTTISDYEEDEKERKSSINLSVLRAEYIGTSLQFIDTPGYLDFVGEVITASHAVDFAVIVIDAVHGIGLSAEKAWEITQAQNIPCLFVVNKLDASGADYAKVFEDIRSNFTKKAVAFGDWVNGDTVNILRDQKHKFYGKILEAVAEANDKLLEEYLSTGSIEHNELIDAIKKSIDNDLLFPVVGVSSLQPKTVGVLLDTIADIMPSCAEALPRGAVDGPFVAQVFKTIIDPFLGRLTLFRIYCGKISANAVINNVTHKCKEKLSHVVFLQGKEQISVDGACAGDIAAVVKLKETQTLDVLTDASNEIVLSELNLPAASYSASITPKTKVDEDKISDALHKLTGEDLTFHATRDNQTNEMIVSGLGELHLQVLMGRMRTRYHVDTELGTPKVAYRETITRKIKAQGKHKKQSGGHGQYGDCWIEIEPLPEGAGFEFVNNITGGAIPKNFIPSIEKGVKKAMEQGVIAGYQVTDIRVHVCDGSYHDVDSSDMAFQIAGSLAMKKALQDAVCVLLEPVMNVQVSAPPELMGAITGDINSRRGKIMGMDVKGKSEVVNAQIPMVEMFRYASDLRSATGGRGTFIMSFSHYAPLSSRLAQEIVAKATRADSTAVNHH
jgi:elongation factor G